MHIALLSPYHGGSHRAWANGYRQYSRHQVQFFTLPARFWKWRMHGGAVTLAHRFNQAFGEDEQSRPDILLATDMLDLTTFRALTKTTPTTILYMHENQLTYPLPAGSDTGPMRRQHGERDYHYAFINYASMLAADEIWFNSQFHLDSWFAALPRFLNRFPEHKELDTIPALQNRSRVMPIGLDITALQETRPKNNPENPVQPVTKPVPLILWNQRWEYDKDPAGFFNALYALQEEGRDFRLALCGENFRRRPKEFDTATDRLADQIIHVGYASLEQYHALLWAADITISTARHEFFGISVLEAIACHTFPILPHRLSYPELLPEPYHRHCLYGNPPGLLERLRWALDRPEERQAIAAALAKSATQFNWSIVADQYDRRLADLGGCPCRLSVG